MSEARMDKFLTIPHFYGPLFTIITTIIYHYLSGIFGYSISGSLLFIVLALGTFAGGQRAGLICAVWTGAYSLFAFPGDPTRVIQITIGGIIIALIIGWQTRKLRNFYKASDELADKNVIRLNVALDKLRYAKSEIKQALKLIGDCEGEFGNVLGSMVGYSELRKNIEEVNTWYNNPDNIQRLREMDEAQEKVDLRRAYEKALAEIEELKRQLERLQ